MSVSCKSERYITARNSIGTLGLAVYAGAPSLLFMAVLWPHRKILEKPLERRTEEEQARVAPTAFLHASYRPGCWWFESFEILRRLAMCGAINTLFERESVTGRLCVCVWLCWDGVAMYRVALLGYVAGVVVCVLYS